jgi:hypothetical protein
MPLWICTACERHVQPHTTRCPFCDTALGTTSAPHRAMMAAALGLALVGCADRGGDNTSAGGETSSTETMGSETSSSASTTMSTAGEGSTSSTTASEPDAGGEDYAGPETDEWGGWEESSTSGAESESTGDSTGTDTGSSTGETEDDAGGQDYAGAETAP